MFPKSKINKLKGDLHRLGISQDRQAKELGTNKVMLGKIFTGDKYDADIIKGLIAIRDREKKKAKQLEDSI